MSAGKQELSMKDLHEICQIPLESMGILMLILTYVSMKWWQSETEGISSGSGIWMKKMMPGRRTSDLSMRWILAREEDRHSLIARWK
jgi:hypothetical protein